MPVVVPVVVGAAPYRQPSQRRLRTHAAAGGYGATPTRLSPRRRRVALPTPAAQRATRCRTPFSGCDQSRSRCPRPHRPAAPQACKQRPAVLLADLLRLAKGGQADAAPHPHRGAGEEELRRTTPTPAPGTQSAARLPPRRAWVAAVLGDAPAAAESLLAHSCRRPSITTASAAKKIMFTNFSVLVGRDGQSPREQKGSSRGQSPREQKGSSGGARTSQFHWKPAALRLRVS